MENILKITYTNSRRGNEMIIADQIYPFNLIYKKKDGIKVFKCVQYRTTTSCKAFILIKNNQIINFSNYNNNITKQTSTIKGETRKKIKSEIQNSNDPFSIHKPKLFKFISVDKGIKDPSLDSIKSSLYKNMNSKLPKEIDSF